MMPVPSSIFFKGLYCIFSRVLRAHRTAHSTIRENTCPPPSGHQGTYTYYGGYTHSNSLETFLKLHTTFGFGRIAHRILNISADTHASYIIVRFALLGIFFPLLLWRQQLPADAENIVQAQRAPQTFSGNPHCCMKWHHCDKQSVILDFGGRFTA